MPSASLEDNPSPSTQGSGEASGPKMRCRKMIQFNAAPCHDCDTRDQSRGAWNELQGALAFFSQTQSVRPPKREDIGPATTRGEDEGRRWNKVPSVAAVRGGKPWTHRDKCRTYPSFSLRRAAHFGPIFRCFIYWGVAVTGGNSREDWTVGD